MAYPAVSEPELEVYGGFAGVTVKNKLNPLYICISERTKPFRASLNITQKLGSPWRGRAKMELAVPSSSWENGCYQTVVPIYDVTEPLKISLVGSKGIKENSQIDLKERWRKEPFPLGVGSVSTSFSLPSHQISPSGLPEKWMTYQSLSSLWIGKTGVGISASRWAAISKWVFMGGKLIIFGGPNFPILDSPKLRKLLPITSPRLVKIGENLRLTGEAKPGSWVSLKDKKGPLMMETDYGAGKVFLVAENSYGPEPKEAKEIESKISPAANFSLKSITGELLGEKKINTPGRVLALLTAFPLLIALLVFSRWPEDNRKKALSLAMAAISLSVIPLMTIGKKHLTRDIYSVSINLHVDVEGGLKTGWQKLYSKRGGRIYLHPEAEPYPMLHMPRKLKGGDFDTSWIGGRGLKLAVEQGSERELVYYKEESSKLNLRITSKEKLEIESRLNYELSKAFITVHDELFRIRGPEKEGEDYKLNPETIRNIAPPYRGILRKTIEGFHLLKGSWFVGISDRTDHTKWNGLSTSSRKIDIHLVKLEEKRAVNDGE